MAADGAHSTVRELLGIPFEGRGVFSNSLTIYFTADVRPEMEGKPLSVIYVNNPTFGGFFRLDKDCRSGFLVINTVGDPSRRAAAADAAADTSERRLIELVRAGVGRRDLDEMTARIGDDESRAGFLERVPGNAELVRLVGFSDPEPGGGTAAPR